MKLGWPTLLSFASLVWKRLLLWIRACFTIAAILANAMQEAEIAPLHVA
jgi:hypothetical protein